MGKSGTERWASQAMARTTLKFSRDHPSAAGSLMVGIAGGSCPVWPSTADIGCGWQFQLEPSPRGDGLAATIASGADVLNRWCSCFGCLGADL
jgi:hypothetical protein